MLVEQKEQIRPKFVSSFYFIQQRKKSKLNKYTICNKQNNRDFVIDNAFVDLKIFIEHCSKLGIQQ